MRIQYEIYRMSSQFDEWVVSVHNTESAARKALAACNETIKDETYYVVRKTLESNSSAQATFTGKAGLDKWLCWTDSHGRPAKRLLACLQKAEAKGE